MFDLDAYLRRIGLAGRPGIAEVHRAHVTAIPFEALDPHMGLPPSLDDDALAAKLVDARRGGYCFEQNLLLARALRELGFVVDLHLARVLVGADPQAPRPRSHLLLRAEAGGHSWHADVGFGGGQLLEPLPWGPGEEHEQAGWRYRIVERRPEWVLQGFEEGAWRDIYAFMPHPVPRVELEPANWFTGSHPGSPFVTGLLLSRQYPDGRRLVLTDWNPEKRPTLTERAAGAAEPPEPVARESLPELLAERFGLPGFELGPDGGLRRSAG